MDVGAWRVVLKPAVSLLVADVVPGCSVDVLLGDCVIRRLTVVSDMVVVLEVVVMRGVVEVRLVDVLVVVLGVVVGAVVVVVVVVVVEGIVVVLGRTAQDKQDNSHYDFSFIHPSSQLPCRHIFIPALQHC